MFPELIRVATLNRLPRLLTESPTGSSAVTASHNLTILEQPAGGKNKNKNNTTNKQQSLKLKVRSIVSDNRAFLIEPSDVSLSSVKRDLAYHVAKWILRTVHLSVPRKRMKRELWNPPRLATGKATFQERKDLLPGALFALECWTHPSPPPLSLSLSQQSRLAALPLLRHANSEPAAAKHLHHALADWSPESAGPA